MNKLASAATALLHRFEPETAHEIAIRGLALGLGPAHARRDVPALSTRLMGLRFPNPIGLAAGFDKDARAVRPLARLGFGHVECGTVTPRPQPGNPAPRLFRLPEDGAIINRMGFNSCGIDRFCRRLARLHRPMPGGYGRGAGHTPVGVNLGINKENASPAQDYANGVARVSPYADYVTINLSSPNTPGLRNLQTAEHLAAILSAIADRNPTRPPLVVKLSPDLAESDIQPIVETAIEHGADGLILTNTTISRPAGLRSFHADEAGGLSGRPLAPLARDMLHRVAAVTKGRLHLIACGGIESGQDVFDRLSAGADMVQIYSSFILDGAGVLDRMKRELLQIMRERNLESIDDIRAQARA
ncbi:dihydroorotate dehydrogenase 2 [Neoasaia chiangmaiensis NBRC 101099]|uniref:Dihydroorotate dehydrogenase (quinone) n=1 Tax=Neoasaia chiangmaiensis TaxID=320497 RepID=A0A1U9KSX6_9PROT|nr:quinone-dependent dihydroorotate dehydrogenase [Neoasaia chiangmaiensis]AQS88918.1 dihydroorotate dehydrogenase [Neoasaia chiangmaiensis]GBR40405.1 dihydroorotate dehydrogenase 2 [Neoasaia chiangmaiensis NBRC 101099]GEN13915.1 dihydroorotate dehydrogenase (quinone) [Neoasaia chiangmaiensis]